MAFFPSDFPPETRVSKTFASAAMHNLFGCFFSIGAFSAEFSPPHMKVNVDLALRRPIRMSASTKA
jgi:hypothetical protein